MMSTATQERINTDWLREMAFAEDACRPVSCGVNEPPALSEQVADIEKRLSEMEDLCGLVIATCHVNTSNGQLTSPHIEDWKSMLEKFRTKFEKLKRVSE